MSVIDGHEFFASEIEPVLATAANYAMAQYNATDDPAWLSANVNIVTTKTKINSMADADANATDGSEPQLIRKGNPLWSEIDAVLVPVASDISDDVDNLPVDSGPLAGAPSWVRPTIVGVGLAAVLGLGWWWVHRK